MFSAERKTNLRWIKWIVDGNLALVVITGIIYGMMLKDPANAQSLLLINIALITPYIYMAAYKGITRLTSTAAPVAAVVSEQQKQETERETRTVEDENRIAAIVSQIIHIMEKDKLYQETELTLKDLADKLKVPSYQVSQAINEGMNKNFYDLINNYRVEEAKRLLLDERNMNYTILSVGFEAGFNSKTTFNTVFKKFTGLTPTQYRQRQATSLLAMAD